MSEMLCALVFLSVELVLYKNYEEQTFHETSLHLETFYKIT